MSSTNPFCFAWPFSDGRTRRGAGILSGGDTIAEDHQTDGSAHNHLFALIIDPDQFTDLAGEKGQFFADYLLATQPQPGGNPVIYPGMPEAANRERNAKMITKMITNAMRR